MEKEFTKNMQSIIRAYEKVLFLPYASSEIVSMFRDYSKGCLKNKILLLMKEEADCGLNDIYCMYLNRHEYIDLKNLYHTYEFSNKFSISSEDSNFGKIWNYVKTGLLTPEEALAALLY